MTFVEQLRATKEGRMYLDIVSSCKDRNLRKERGFEFHHIQPKALGGSNDKENLVKVSTFDHCRLHALLAIALPCSPTLKAITRISAGQIQKLSDLEKTTLEEVYEWSKLRNLGLHAPVSFETRKKMSESRKGIQLSEETKQKLREVNLGKVMSEEIRKKIRESVTRSKAAIKRVYVNRDGKSKAVPVDDLQEYLDSGWKRGWSKEDLASRPSKLGHPVSQETKNKIRESLTGHRHSEESRKKMSETRKNKANGRTD